MAVIHSIILGIVQGLTEFLPISSSAHLYIFPWVLNWERMGEGFEVALHMGTLLAILVFFYKDWIALIKGGYNQVVKKKKSTEGKMFWYIIFATIPTAVLCLVFDKLSDKIVEFLQEAFKIGDKITAEMMLIGPALIIMGIVLYLVDKKAKQKTEYKDITFKQSLWIAMSQAIAAAFPGVSRSGITMTVGRGMGIKRTAIAKYSFLLSAPVVAGATIVNLKHFSFDIAFILGVLSSFLVGMFVIKFLLKFLQKGSFKIFAIYRVVLGVIVLGLLFARI